ncbi:hypothetical protein F8388_003193 [Cannabis sativa]|uniref:hAT-like transposase RNase-H fold domain-containing protein n=1 Tax=Cannabis sativa TaxID=3483 RepID=A0A7J6EEJ7_CANSA|nr:hypothetical protein F8388_003193 [Cannabis sativa]
MLTFIANILDPRYKLEVVNRGFRFVYNPSEADKMIKMVTNTLAHLYAFYKQQQTTQPSEAQQSQAPPSHSKSQVMDHVLLLMRILKMSLEVEVGQRKSTKISSVGGDHGPWLLCLLDWTLFSIYCFNTLDF